MKYNPPYGMESTPDAPYINGNPSTGTMGSIPPAASIEYPQREIVEAIAEAGLTPDNGDLQQLMKAMKRVDVHNVWKAAVNGGNASQWSAAVATLAIVPPPVGTQIWFKPNYDSVIGGTVFSVNGSAFAPVVQTNLRAITQGDVVASAWILLFFDGTHWQIIAGAASSAASGSIPLLQKNTDWYVNGTTGNDTTYDGTSATVLSATVGPFKTIQRACNEVLKYNMNFYNQTIHIADGTYLENVVTNALNGTGMVHLTGNETSPANVNVGTGATNSIPIAQADGNYLYSGLRLAGNANTMDLIAISSGNAQLQNLRLTQTGRWHISSQYNAWTTMYVGGLGFVIEAGAHCQSHVCAALGGTLTSPAGTPALQPSVNILGGFNCTSGYAQANGLGVMQFVYAAGGITGPGTSGVNGPKYYATGNGVIGVNGRGAGYYPGSVGGSVDTGGQYIG